MDITTLEMPVEEAKRLFDEYRALGVRATAEDEAIMTAYAEIAKGHPLIDVRRAIADGGHDDLGRPLLAFGRADEQEIMCHRVAGWDGRGYIGNGVLRMFPTVLSRTREFGSISASRRVDVPAGALGGWPPLKGQWFAMMPIIPPALRPTSRLLNYHILWEAEWRSSSALPRPPRDPALLRHITGDLYAVLGVWDLTDVERAVLGMTRR